jgi:hypothetical protein
LHFAQKYYKIRNILHPPQGIPFGRVKKESLCWKEQKKEALRVSLWVKNTRKPSIMGADPPPVFYSEVE